MTAEKIADLLPEFTRALLGDGRARRTTAVYGESIGQFIAWTEAAGRPATLDELTRTRAREWAAELRDTGRAVNTVRTRLIALAKFASWLAAESDEPNRLAGLSLPPAEIKPVPLLADEDLAALLALCAGRDFTSRRDELIIRMLVDTGMRAAELLSLRLDDLDLTGQTALITGKGGKRRSIHWGAKTAKALDRYLRVRRQHAHAGLPQVFISSYGRFTGDGLRNRLERLGQQAGVRGRVHPHRFRHTMADDWLAHGGAEHDLMRLAGWSSSAMLDRYGAAGADRRAGVAARRMARGDRV